MPVSARVAVDRRARRTGDAGHRFEPLQSRVDREIDESLQRCAALDMRPSALPRRCDAFESFRTTPRNPASATIRFVPPPITTVSSPLDRAIRHASMKLSGIARLGENIGGSADAEARVVRQASVAENGGFGQRGELLERLLNAIH